MGWDRMGKFKDVLVATLLLSDLYSVNVCLPHYQREMVHESLNYQKYLRILKLQLE